MDTKFKTGQKGNPGGFTREQRAARDIVQSYLVSSETLSKGLDAYVRLINADNPLIVKDFMDRVAGKVKENIELAGDVNVVLSELHERIKTMTDDQILAMANEDK